MDLREYLLIVNGSDATDRIAAFRVTGAVCKIQYNNSDQLYDYSLRHVQILRKKQEIDPSTVVVQVNGETIPSERILAIVDFGPYYRLLLLNNRSLLYPSNTVKLIPNSLSNDAVQNLFGYLKQAAQLLSLETPDHHKILVSQYNRVQSIRNDTALSSYLNKRRQPKLVSAPQHLIYPFGMNLSQKQAVENAFACPVSIIQGPPGTGKTQTILNIIANAVYSHKTVAVVCNNNPAVENVEDKLQDKGLSFLSAHLGRLEHREQFFASQGGSYPDMSPWQLSSSSKHELTDALHTLTDELDEMLQKRTRLAEIEQELLALKPEQTHFEEYYRACIGRNHWLTNLDFPSEADVRGLKSDEILSLWTRYEDFAEKHKHLLWLLRKVAFLFKNTHFLLRWIQYPPEAAILFLQKHFYTIKLRELQAEKHLLETAFTDFTFETKMAQLNEISLALFQANLAKRYRWNSPRKQFEMEDLWNKSHAFLEEYPIVLSTTYSIKSCIAAEAAFDYLIVDEASQVDLVTGVLALSCARNVVIVGDSKQLPNVLSHEDREAAEQLWAAHDLDPMYNVAKHSLLSSAVERWPKVPSVLLREHYRCHPKIIEFCNRKFYHGELLIQTEDHGEPNVLSLYKTTEGNHAMYNVNQRQIDVVIQEVIPALEKDGYRDIAVITPYRAQAEALSSQLHGKYEVCTVHKYQGREKEAIILTTVDNTIGPFVDNPNLLNVAVSRATKALVVVMSPDPRNARTNYGDLARYIEYNNCTAVSSSVYSIFDLLYAGHARQRRAYLKDHQRISEFDSENIAYAVIEEVLEQEEFHLVGCAAHVALSSLIRDTRTLTAMEQDFVSSALTHTDFLLYHKLDKAPLLAIEIDGVSMHPTEGTQKDRDDLKDDIFLKCGIPLLRIRTNESGVQAKIEAKLRAVCSPMYEE